jgi:hypothetical protein
MLEMDQFKVQKTNDDKWITSCSTWRMEICEGIGSSRPEMCRSSVVFPTPFLPTRPYFLPKFRLRLKTQILNSEPAN